MLSVLTAVLVILGVAVLLVGSIVVTVLVANGDLDVPLLSRRARALLADEAARRPLSAAQLD